MRTSKFTPEHMVHILRQGESGVPIGELCRQHQISGLPPRWTPRVPSRTIDKISGLLESQGPSDSARGRSN